jgi:hypothetical protein
MVFRDRGHGNVAGDAVGGRIAYFTTNDGGETWTRSTTPGLEAGDGATGVFAASNSSLLAGSREPMLFGTVGGYIYAVETTGNVSFLMKPGTRIQMHEQWTRYATPLKAPSDSSGIFSVGYRAGNVPGHGYTLVAVGGDYKKPDATNRTAAWSYDRKHWTAATKSPHGFRSAVAWDADAKAWITVGTNGSDISYDDGKTWTPLDNGNWNALSLPWVVGPHGRIGKLEESKLPKR